MSDNNDDDDVPSGYGPCETRSVQIEDDDCNEDPENPEWVFDELEVVVPPITAACSDGDITISYGTKRIKVLQKI